MEEPFSCWRPIVRTGAAQQPAARCATSETSRGIQTTTRRLQVPPEGEEEYLAEPRSAQRSAGLQVNTLCTFVQSAFLRGGRRTVRGRQPACVQDVSDVAHNGGRVPT